MSAARHATVANLPHNHPGTTRMVNETRTARSIPWKLVREGKGYLLPLYYALRNSDLAREGIDHSGSYRFADHIYVGEPHGRGAIGYWIDRALLSMPSARSFRSRYVHARESIVRFVRRNEGEPPYLVASAPCGVARELADAAAELQRLAPERLPQVRWTGLDLDPAPLALSSDLMARRDISNFTPLRQDALAGLELPSPQHLITSTGFGEFLTDAELVDFYGSCRTALLPGGWLVTSATRRHPMSDFLLRTFGELHTNYRDRETLVAALRSAGFERVYARPDAIGLQTLAVAVA